MGTLRWLGQSAFEVISDGKIILIDPFLTGNPKAAISASEIARADIVCVTHDHADHLGDSIGICKRTGATFVGVYELGVFAQEQGIKDSVAMNIGGTVEVKGVKISMVRAHHSATRGTPVGFVLDLGRVKIYHAGDTGLFGDMRTIGWSHKPDIACLPIGGYYTMDAREAAEAVRLILPKVVVPMHYLTFPVLAQSAEDFLSWVRIKAPGVRVAILKPGETYKF